MTFELLKGSHVWTIMGASIDILLVAYVIYRVLLLIRGTRAQQVLVGLGLIVTGFFVSKLMGFKTLSWILDNFISSFLLVIIVVFQHDIRRVLSRVGRRPFLSAIGFSQGAYIIEEIVQGVEAMAKDKIGALILIEREGDLSELTETGIAVDARLSAPLLVQLFTSPGPLHDGAVVISQGRIAAAAVFLPLTQSARVEPVLGTRHRAAVGATEEVDAIAIVVSEERGQISIVEGGMLTRDLDPQTLRRVLQRYISPRLQREAHPEEQL
jgi:diadenylate cyclase